METARRITITIPAGLLEKAQRATGGGIAQTVRTGLQLVAASGTYARLRQLRGNVHFTRTLADLNADRSSQPKMGTGLCLPTKGPVLMRHLD